MLYKVLTWPISGAKIYTECTIGEYQHDGTTSLVKQIIENWYEQSIEYWYIHNIYRPLQGEEICGDTWRKSIRYSVEVCKGSWNDVKRLGSKSDYIGGSTKGVEIEWVVRKGEEL